MYSATSDGRIISEERLAQTRKRGSWLIKERVLKSAHNRITGYFSVNLYHNGKQSTHYVHRLVGSAFGLIDLGDSKQQIDHIDHNPRNNHLDNLRAATNQQNNAWRSRAPNGNNTSGYTGVFWDKSRGKWMAAIGYNCKFKNLGRFKCKHEAAAAYNTAARELFGEFAFQNEIKEAA